MSQLGDELFEALGFHAAADESGHLRIFCDAWAATLSPVYELVRDREDGRPGWAILYDVDEVDAEHLPHTAQYVGARLTPQMDEAQQRAEVAAPTTWKRGQTETFKTTLRQTLTGSKRVIVRERTPEPWSLYVRVLLEECPDPSRTEAVAKANKVAGLVMDFEAIDGVTWADIAAAYEDWGEVESTFSDWADLADTLPDELPE